MRNAHENMYKERICSNDFAKTSKNLGRYNSENNFVGPNNYVKKKMLSKILIFLHILV